jgi:hypothetical protein
MAQLALDFAPAPSIPLYFASGSNHAGEILGLVDVDMAVGVAVNHVKGRAMTALESLAGTGTSVFVDSGAFSEICFHPRSTKTKSGYAKSCKCADRTRPQVKKPITDAEWNKRLSAMERLADALGSQLYPVAPDKVGFQAETLERLTRHQLRVRRLMARGANVIVPLQKGAQDLASFYDSVVEVLGTDGFVVGIPMKKDATATADLVELLKARPVARLHLLGLGPRSNRWAEVMAAIEEHAPGCEVTCDSVLIRTLVGRTNGPNKGPRALTVAQDRAAAEAKRRAGEEQLNAVAWCKRLAIREVLGAA